MWIHKMKMQFRSVADSATTLVVGPVMGLTGIVLSASVLNAQAQEQTQEQARLEIPPITWSHDAHRTVTAPEAAYHVSVKEMLIGAKYSFHDEVHMVSILEAVAGDAATLLTEVEKWPIKGIQLDPAGRVSVFAKNEATAQQKIAQRLATPGLSLADRAYTYAAAVSDFSDWRYPDRLPTAEEYMTALSKLGTAAALWQLQARYTMVKTYKMLGKSDAVIRHGMQAIKLMPQAAYGDQLAGFGVAGEMLDALSGMPDAQAQLDTIAAILKASIDPPAALLVQDSAGVVYVQGIAQNAYNMWIKQRSLLGQVGEPFVAQYWVNRGSTDSASIPLNDGKIRIVELFSYGCDGCVGELSVLERIKRRNPNIEVMGITWTFGNWGNRAVEAKEEARALGEQFITRKKFTLPIGIWYSKFEEGEYGYDGVKAWTGGNYDNYPATGKATFMIIDGKGRVRRYMLGGGEEAEIEMERTVQFLQKEAAAKQVSLSGSPSNAPSGAPSSVAASTVAHNPMTLVATDAQ
jgi:hypothetical protein